MNQKEHRLTISNKLIILPLRGTTAWTANPWVSGHGGYDRGVMVGCFRWIWVSSWWKESHWIFDLPGSFMPGAEFVSPFLWNIRSYNDDWLSAAVESVSVFWQGRAVPGCSITVNLTPRVSIPRLSVITLFEIVSLPVHFDNFRSWLSPSPWTLRVNFGTTAA